MKKIILNLIFAIVLIFASTNVSKADFSIYDMELNFVQISDTHISEKDDTNYKALSSSRELLRDAIEQVNSIRPVDFVMFTGDMVNEPDKESYFNFFKELTKLKYPALMAFGNHDIRQLQVIGDDAPDNVKKYLTKNDALRIIKACNPFYIFDKSYYAFSPRRQYRVIVLDTTVDDTITSNGRLTDEAAAFLKEEIESHKDKVILIFEHHPVVEPFKSAHHKILNADSYLDILKEYKRTPIAIFSGHYHAAKVAKHGNVIHVSTPSLVTYPNAFRYVKITNYDDRTIFVFKFFETNLLDVRKKSKINALAAATLGGLPSDRNVEVTIRKTRDNDNEVKEKEVKPTKEDKQIQKEIKKAQKQIEKEEKAKNKKLKKDKAKKETVEEIPENMEETIDTIQDAE